VLVTKHSIDNLIDSFTVYLEVNKNYSKGTVEIYNHTIVRLASWLKEAKNITILRTRNSVNDYPKAFPYKMPLNLKNSRQNVNLKKEIH
jgi:site-specific recombinase XerD